MTDLGEAFNVAFEKIAKKVLQELMKETIVPEIQYPERMNQIVWFLIIFTCLPDN